MVKMSWLLCKASVKVIFKVAFQLGMNETSIKVQENSALRLLCKRFKFLLHVSTLKKPIGDVGGCTMGVVYI